MSSHDFIEGPSITRRPFFMEQIITIRKLYGFKSMDDLIGQW